MGLIDDREDIIRAFNRQRDESAVLDNKDLVLRIGDDSSLVLGYLNDYNTKELNDRIGDL
jgi:hypothetical protein